MKKITSFLRTLGSENIAQGTVQKLYNAGFDTIFKVLKARVKDFMKVPGIQSTIANKIADNIDNALDNITLQKLMDASGTFDRTMGETRLGFIVKAYPKILEMDESKLLPKLLTVSGVQVDTATSFINSLPAFKKFYAKLDKIRPISFAKATKTKLASNLLSGYNIVFTGVRDQALEKIIEANGGVVGSGVSNKTSLLVIKDTSSISTKSMKAKDLGLKVLTLDKFRVWLQKQVSK